MATQQTFFLQVSQSGYADLINGHASLQIIANMSFCILWLTCKQSLLGGHGKARRTVKECDQPIK